MRASSRPRRGSWPQERGALVAMEKPSVPKVRPWNRGQTRASEAAIYCRKWDSFPLVPAGLGRTSNISDWLAMKSKWIPPRQSPRLRRDPRKTPAPLPPRCENKTRLDLHAFHPPYRSPSSPSPEEAGWGVERQRSCARAPLHLHAFRAKLFPKNFPEVMGFFRRKGPSSGGTAGPRTVSPLPEPAGRPWIAGKAY
jgi:hypothetical protein